MLCYGGQEFSDDFKPYSRQTMVCHASNRCVLDYVRGDCVWLLTRVHGTRLAAAAACAHIRHTDLVSLLGSKFLASTRSIIMYAPAAAGYGPSYTAHSSLCVLGGVLPLQLRHVSA